MFRREWEREKVHVAQQRCLDPPSVSLQLPRRAVQRVPSRAYVAQPRHSLVECVTARRCLRAWQARAPQSAVCRRRPTGMRARPTPPELSQRGGIRWGSRPMIVVCSDQWVNANWRADRMEMVVGGRHWRRGGHLTNVEERHCGFGRRTGMLGLCCAPRFS